MLRNQSPSFDPRVGHSWPLKQLDAERNKVEPAAAGTPAVDAPTPAEGETPAPAAKRKAAVAPDPNLLLARALDRTVAAMQREGN